jgi:hypothetical protein
MRVRSVLAGALALIVLEIVVTSEQASGRVGGFFAGVAAITNWFLDPGVPGIPDRTSAPTSASPGVVLQQVDTGNTPASSPAPTQRVVLTGAYSN